MELITLSIGRNILIAGSRDRRRMALYAEHLSALHIVVLTRTEHGFTSSVHEGALHIYPTNSSSRFAMLIDAFRVAYRILKSGNKKSTITAQDPLELGLLSYILSRLTQTPYTVQVHGDYYAREWAGYSFVQRMRRTVIPFVLKHAVRVRVVSTRIKTSLCARGTPETKIVVLPIRPELEVFEKAGEERNEPEEFTVLTASRLAPEKNIPGLVRAFGMLHAKHSGTRLRIVGEGSERTRIEAEIHRCGLDDVVTLVPWSEHIENEMARAHIFALASLHEAYGLVLIEALATGTPVVTTDVGCAGELVIDGEHGYVVPVENDRAFAYALIHLYEDSVLRERMAHAGRALGKMLGARTEEVYAKEWVATHTA